VDINTVTPSIYTYDPNTFPTFNFISFNSILTKVSTIYKKETMIFDIKCWFFFRRDKFILHKVIQLAIQM
jgi:hypothetical protein